MRRLLIAMLTSAGLLFAVPAGAQVLDINSASAQELDALPGIGPARAAAIVKGRPYRSKDELVRKKILPQNIYDKIKERLVAHGKS